MTKEWWKERMVGIIAAIVLVLVWGLVITVGILVALDDGADSTTTSDPMERWERYEEPKEPGDPMRGGGGW